MKRTHPLAVFAIALAAVAAVALACPTNAAPDRPGVTPELIQDAIGILEFNRDDAQWTKSGKPRVDAIEALLEANISAADRDAAWKALKAPAPAVAPTAPDTGQVAEFEAQIAHLKATVSTGVDVVAALERRVAQHEETIVRERTRADTAEAAIDAAERKARQVVDDYAALNAGARERLRQASADRATAARVLEEAKAREAGAGPPASRDCRRALRKVLNADWTWAGNLKAEEADVIAAVAACFPPEEINAG